MNGLGVEAVVRRYGMIRDGAVGSEATEQRAAEDRFLLLRALRIVLPEGARERAWMMLHVERADL